MTSFLFLTLLLSLTNCQNFSQFFSIRYTKQNHLTQEWQNLTILQNNLISTAWNFDSQAGSICHPCSTIIAIPNKDETNEFFEFKNLHESNIAQVKMSIVSFDAKVSHPKFYYNNKESEEIEFFIQPQQTENIYFDFNCLEQINSDQIKDWNRIKFKIQAIFTTSEFITIYPSLIKICSYVHFSKFDYSIIILLSFACFLVWYSSSSNYLEVGDQQIQEASELGMLHVMIFLFFGSAFLILLYYFMQYMLYLLTFVFSFMIISCFIAIFHSIYSYFQIQQLQRIIFQSSFFGNISIGDLSGFLIGVACLIYYLITKNWLFNNLFATVIVIVMIRTVKMPNFIIGSSFLLVAFFYDIFWVFYSQNYFGQSVMEYVATQVDLPMKLVFPILKDYYIKYQCSLIGLGDLALPGFVISFANKLDNEISKNCKIKTRYFQFAMAGYILGIILCAFFLIVFSTAQPALLYLSPCVILSIVIQAIYQKQLKFLFNKKLRLDLVRQSGLKEEMQVYNIENKTVKQMLFQKN